MQIWLIMRSVVNVHKCVLVCGVLIASASGLGARDEVVFGGLTFPKPGYAKALEKSVVEEIETEGLEVEISVITDLYVFAMAKGFEELHKTGYSGAKLESEIKKLYSKAKKEKGKAAFHVRVTGGRGDCHYFLQSKLEKHIDASGGARASGKVELRTPRYKFVTWTLMQGSASKKRKMMLYDELDFIYPIKLKKGDKPIELKFKDFVRYKEVPKKSEYEYRGINIDVKQISLGDFRDLHHPPFAKTFYPGKWKLPKAPPGFKELLAHLDGGK